ncbi:MAG: glutathione S-transferase N-terminal domain-containing protein [Pseudomonadota bacterium]
MHVEVYGGKHSPWVHAVLLALHEQHIEYTLRSTPPLAVIKQWGVYMPAVSIDGGPWAIESADIVERLGFAALPERDKDALRGAWRGVHHRPANPLRFFAAFSRAGDRSDSLWRRARNNFLRSFIPFYMFTMITFFKWKMQPTDPEDYGAQFLYWEAAVGENPGPFLDGDTPGTRDFMLFGMIQCHSSIPVPPLVPLREDARLDGLRGWIRAMHTRFGDYPLLYSSTYFAPELPRPQTATLGQRLIFCAGLATMILSFPITLPLVFVLMTKAPR